MTLPKIENIEIRQVTKNILLIHQIKHPFFFSCCDGLFILPTRGQNKKAIILDLNIEPKYVFSLDEIYGPISNYICSHGHLDHTCHVHAWEEVGATIYAPQPEAEFLLDLHIFYKGYGFDEKLNFKTVKSFAKANGFQKCTQVNSFRPGESLKFEDFKINTFSFSGHSNGHTGFFLPDKKVFHISCLGFDKPSPQIEGYGPWYGFKQCSITQYREDINNAERIFLSNGKCLTSSHAYIIKYPDNSPFDYMREKIRINQEKVDKALREKKLLDKSESRAVEELLKMDLFFPKKKLNGFVLDIYRFWESWIIRKHIQQNQNF